MRSGSLSAAHCLVCALADVSLPDRWLRPPLIRALEISKPIASMLLLQCGARLPPGMEQDAAVAEQMREALKTDMCAHGRSAPLARRPAAPLP